MIRNSAKYLWKRIPKNNKEDSIVLQSIWNVGKTLIKKEYKNVYQVGLFEWDTPQLQLLCDAFIGKDCYYIDFLYQCIEFRKF